MLALQRGDGVASRHLAVPPLQVQARLLRRRAAELVRGAGQHLGGWESCRRKADRGALRRDL